jgi:Family of unknown function (DUF6535)
MRRQVTVGGCLRAGEGMSKQSCFWCGPDHLSFDSERPLTRQRKSGLLSATVATFLSYAYFAAQPNSQDVSVFDLSKVYPFLTSSIGITFSPSATPSEPWMVSVPAVIHALWFTSLVVSLGCAMFAALLQRRVCQYLLMTRPEHSPRVHVPICMHTTQERSLMNLEALFHALHTSFLMSILLFVWGLGIQLLRAANSPSVLVIFGLSTTFFLGQYLILYALQRFPSYDAEASLV